jgi:uncharacterized protein
MYIGTLYVRLILRETRSLKDKRQVVRSICDRLKNGFNIAISEVDDRDEWHSLVLGIVTVSDESEAVRSMLQTIQTALRSHPVAEYVTGKIETMKMD